MAIIQFLKPVMAEANDTKSVSVSSTHAQVFVKTTEHVPWQEDSEGRRRADGLDFTVIGLIVCPHFLRKVRFPHIRTIFYPL